MFKASSFGVQPKNLEDLLCGIIRDSAQSNTERYWTGNEEI